MNFIANWTKTIKVRKAAPKEVPFKCYIYETKGNGGRGKVIGEVVCDRVYFIENKYNSFVIENNVALTNEVARGSRLDYLDMREYLGNKNGYGWHISELKLYGTPKDLSEFAKPSKEYHKIYEEDGHLILADGYTQEPITRPPESWQYCEEKK